VAPGVGLALTTLLLGVAALAGAVAVVRRMLRAGAQLVLDLAHRTTAIASAEAAARRGDITARDEALHQVTEAGRCARGDAAALLGWGGALLAAILSPFTLTLLAAAALLWLAPVRPLRTSPAGTGVGTRRA
jgi:hypothetical protein